MLYKGKLLLYIYTQHNLPSDLSFLNISGKSKDGNKYMNCGETQNSHEISHI